MKQLYKSSHAEGKPGRVRAWKGRVPSACRQGSTSGDTDQEETKGKRVSERKREV